MNKLYVLLALLVVGGLGYYFLMPKCEQPDQITTVMIQLQCAQSLDIPALRAELCQQQHGMSECQLEESDRPAGEQLFMRKVNECAKQVLKKNNLCTDKYEEIQ